MAYPQKTKYNNCVSLYNQGMSIQDIATFHGVTRQAMHDILKRRGAQFRSNKKYGKENHFFRGTKASNRVHDILELAMEKGIVTRKTHCELCQDTGVFKDGRTKIQAHHPDYNKPLDVMWLCQKCHHQWHKENKATPLSIELPKMTRKEIASMGGKVKKK